MTPDDRRASIIAATIPLLRDKGRAVSTKEIARASGIAEGTIFRVFGSKDEIVVACVHEAFDTSALVLELARVDRALDLRDRLAQGVTVMQDHLKGIFALMTVLHSTGQPLHRPSGEDAARRRREATAEVDAAFADLIGPDAERLRIPATTFIGYLRMLTLSSVHPMLDGQDSTALELVDVILQGALRRSDPRHSSDGTTQPAQTDRTATRGDNQCSSG